MPDLIGEVYFSELTLKSLEVPFSEGDFKPVRRKQQRSTAAVQQKSTSQTAEEHFNAGVFSCPNDGCTRVFTRLYNLERHLSFENCTKSLERQPLLDIAKSEYALLLQEGAGVIPTLHASAPLSEQGTAECASEGWALKESKKPYQFNEKQKQYLTTKFNIGQSTGRKIEGDVVAKEMRRAVDNDGKRLFSISEFLTAQQITSFFSRLSVKARQHLVATNEDVAAAQEEINFDATRQEILLTLDLQHPIVYDQYNLCAMVSGDKLKGLKLPLLKLICEKFDIEIRGADRRKLLPHVEAIKTMVFGCSCRGKDVQVL